MSRIGKKIIEIPVGVEVVLEKGKAFVKGSKGSVLVALHPFVDVLKEGMQLTVSPKPGIDLEKSVVAIWGLSRQLLSNAIQGVTQGFEKKLEIEGVGYRAALEGDSLVLSVGFTEPVRLKIPEGIKITVEKEVISVAGPEKEEVGQFAATIRGTRPVEPYKGKGIKYQNEVVRRKLGKRAAATAGASGAK